MQTFSPTGNLIISRVYSIISRVYPIIARVYTIIASVYLINPRLYSIKNRSKMGPQQFEKQTRFKTEPRKVETHFLKMNWAKY